MALKIKENNRKSIQKEESIKEIIKDDTTLRMNIIIPKSLHSNFKIKAIKNNTNMSDLVIKWIKDYVME